MAVELIVFDEKAHLACAGFAASPDIAERAAEAAESPGRPSLGRQGINVPC